MSNQNPVQELLLRIAGLNLEAGEIGAGMLANIILEARRLVSTDDRERLNYLERLLIHCPHAEIGYNEDKDIEDKHGMKPVGFFIRVEGCKGVQIAVGATLRLAIDNDIRGGEEPAPPPAPQLTHSIERTSPKGGPFLGTCRLCGQENLNSGDALKPCPNTRGLSADDALLDAITDGLTPHDAPGDFNEG